MNNIYILFEGVNAVKNAKVHGGGSYSRWITNELVLYINNNNLQKEYKINILWPLGVAPQTIEEKAIYDNKSINILEINNIKEVKFTKNDKLFIPLLESCHIDLERLKKENPNLIIYAVIHGMRNVDLAKFDKFQVYYHSWYKPIPGMKILSYFRQLNIKRKEINLVKMACKNCNKIFTDSNNSMQLINKYGKPNWIKYYHPASIIPYSSEKIEYKFDDRYMLIINSNRNEKNSIRTLISFCEYKKENPHSDLKFYMVGVTKQFQEKLKFIKEIDKECLQKNVVMFEYVSSKELSDLFKQCYFLIYPSKSEGYGLPLLDAMEAQRPVVASRVTSVPEVLGASAYYVNPYSIESIKKAIKYMYKTENNEFYKELMIETKRMVNLRQNIDKNILINDILKNN